MGTVNVTLGDGKKLNLPLGRQGENEVTAVVFDFSAWSTEFGSGTLSLSVQRHGDELPYAVTMTTSGTNATWTISDLDTAYKGTGEAQVKYTVGTKVKKSAVYNFTVNKSLGQNGEYPSPGQTWQEEIEDEIAEVKEDFDNLSNTGEFIINLTKVDGKYIGTSGNISNETGMCYAVVPVFFGDVLTLNVNPNGSINVISYSPTETLTTPLEKIKGGSGNTLQTFTWNVNKNGYAVVSGKSNTLEVIINRKSCRNQPEYDVYIAGSNSAYKNKADFVCTGENDDEIINSVLANDSVKSVYFFGDSTFNLSAPLVLKTGMMIKTNGAVFTQPAMVTTTLTYAQTDLTSKLLRVVSAEGFKPGQYVYIQDDNGQNMYNIIESVYKQGNNSITFKNAVDLFWTPDNNVVIKTANPCFVLDHITNVVIDGVHIDWNVSENPIQTYNPSFLQEGISIQYSHDVTIKNCLIENGGRRGICTTDSTDIFIDKCIFDNWHEHGIDIFNGYTTEGNTQTVPMLNNVIITSVISRNNKMNGIQLHRGSGCVVDNCICYGNIDVGIGMAEYAHDNIVSNSFLHDNAIGVVIRTGSYRNNIDGNMIKDNTRGIYIRGTSAMRSAENRISNNLLSDITADGILVENSDVTIINDNRLLNTSADMAEYKPILCASCTHSYILQNSIKQTERMQTTTYAIRCAGGQTDYNVVKGNIIHNANAPSTTGSHDVVENNVVF